MLRTARLLPPCGFRRWAPAPGVTPRRRQPATRLPGNYLDGTLTHWQRRACGHMRSNHRAHRPPIPSRVPSGHATGAPSAQQRVDIRDHLTDVRSGTVAAGPVPDLVPEPFHRPLRGPAVQVVADDPLLFPQPPGHAGVKMAAEEVQSFPAFPEVYYFRLVRVQLQPEGGKDLPHRLQGRLSLCRAPAQPHAAVGVQNQLTHTAPGALSLQDIQDNAAQQA